MILLPIWACHPGPDVAKLAAIRRVLRLDSQLDNLGRVLLHPALSEREARNWVFYRGDCRYEIFSTRPEHLNDGWRPTAVDVPAAPSARSTLPPIPSPLIIPASRAQLIRAAQGSSPNARREAELGHAGDLGFARFFQRR